MTLKGTFGEYVVIDPVKLAEWQRGSDGPVVRYLIEQGEKVKQRAIELVGVYVPPDAYSAAHRLGPDRKFRRPGTLRDSIVKRIVEIDGAPAVIVGSEDPIALWHHEGTAPHLILPRSKPLLVFFWKRVGRVVALRSVNHPGTKPTRFLVKALEILR